jgi:glycosyltransferase involved in cell wall biosynthesis
LIEALARLPGVQALIVGKALFRGEQEYAAELERLTQTMGIAGRVRFLGFREDIPRLMKLSDVIVHTSIAPEPFGRVIVEAMLAEKPVVASRGGGANEIVDHLGTGFLVTPGDPAELTNAIRIFLDHPDIAADMASAGRARALRTYSAKAMLSAIEEEIDKCKVEKRR